MKKTIILALLGILLTGCGTTYLDTSTLVNPQKKSYDKVLVIARTKDNTARINFENQVARDLAEGGVQATASSAIIRPSMFEGQQSEAQVQKLKNLMITEGYDGVIVTNLINAEQYTDVVPGNTNTAYVPVRYGRFGRYYRSYPVTYWEPDQIVEGVEYTLESCLYDISDNEGDNLQWVGRFKLKDPSNLNKTIEKYSEELTTELLEKSIQAGQ